MARRSNGRNGTLEESMKAMQQALAQMLQAQTTFMARMAESDKELAQLRRGSEAESERLRRRMDETDRLNAERFARVEERLVQIEATLAELPRAVHRQFGFQPPPSPAS